MKRNLLIIGILLLGAGCFFAYRMYNAKTPTASERAADVDVDAVALFQAFSQDEVAAGKLYNDKVLQVKGTVREVSSPGNGPVNVLLETGDAMGAVVCEFPPDAVLAWQKGQNVTIKGFCAGFMLDVLLQRCAAVE
ncbi:MAG: hypothetical protein KA791_04955 [Flavobacteriales bacterium]|nr:hypothetical protein [Flavobacteriales bacterium]